MRRLKMVCLADTHSQHRRVRIPYDCDILIHAGDICYSLGLHEREVLQRNVAQLEDFNDWLGGLNVKHKIVIGGNHDFALEHLGKELAQVLLSNAVYLENSGVEIESIKFFGSPHTPWFGKLAFTSNQNQVLDWSHVPDDTDVLITHGPPRGFLDSKFRTEPAGCPQLTECVKRVVPRFHIFGHIHLAYGKLIYGRTTFANVALADKDHVIRKEPITLLWKD